MKRLLIPFILFFFIAFNGISQTTVKTQSDRMEWWRNARFGMFIHWGLYAVPAGEWNGKTEYGEWIRTSAQIPLETYDQFMPQFNPVKFNADEWVKMARDAGMRYLVITSKHHEGFCMFNTKQTDFCIMNTPFHHDPMKDLAEACHKYGVVLCFYYSIMDWHHPDYLPRRDWEKDRPAEGADFSRYMKYMKAELKELLTQYGKIGVLWFDGEWEKTWNEKYGKEIYDYCRSLQPDLIINNRVGAGRIDWVGMTKKGAFGGDFGTPEQQIPATGIPGLDWETCMTMNDHWGYNKNDKNFKSTREILRMLADIASKGGNYLLNVGPTAEGLFPQESIDRLREIGQWMKVNGESIYGTKASPFATPEWGRVTQKDIPGGTRLYLHVFNWPSNGNLIIRGLLNAPLKAFLLSDPKAASLRVSRIEDRLILSLPATAPDPVNSVIVLDLRGKPDLTDPPEFHSSFDIFIDTLCVRLYSPRENISIHYTFDGSEPSIKSPEYSTPLVLDHPVKVSARCFREGKPVSGTSRKEFRKVSPEPPSPAVRRTPGIMFSCFEGSWDSIPAFASLRPVKQGVTKGFLLDDRSRDEYFGMVYNGYFKIPETGIYRFYVTSDDGSALYIDGKKVVNNDGLHSLQEAEGIAALAEGLHAIRVEYFNKTGDFGLQVSFSGQSLKKQSLPDNLLFQ